MATMIRDIGDRMVQALDDLKNGKITPDQARAMAGVAQAAVRRTAKNPDRADFNRAVLAMGRLINYSKEMQHDAR